MSEPAPKTPFLMSFPPALVVAGAGAAGYWLAHVYEASFLAHFGLPGSLVRVSTNTTLVAAGATLSTVWGAFLTAVLVPQLLGRGSLAAFSSGIFILSTMAFRLSVGVHLFGRAWREWLPWLVGFLVSLVIMVLVARWKARPAAPSAGGTAAEPEPNADLVYAVATPGVVSALAPWIGREGLLLLWALFLAQDVARDAGRAKAEQQSEFMIADGRVVLRAYDDLLIAAPFNRATREIGEEYVLIGTGGRGTTTVRRETVGPLRLAESKPPPPAPAVQAPPVAPAGGPVPPRPQGGGPGAASSPPPVPPSR